MYTILIVDDSSITQRTVSTQLRRHGFATISAETAAQARVRLATESIDLIILDLGIPDADGITLLRELRRNKAFQSVPVIVLTASGHDSDRIDARSAGATAFVTKPASTSELLQNVNRALAISAYAEPARGLWEGAQPHLR